MLSLALAAALLVPQEANAAPQEILVETAHILDSLLAKATGPMTLTVGDAENPLTYESMVKQYAELTGQHIVMSDDSSSMLRHQLHLDRTLTVPAVEVQTTFEHLLRKGDFVLTPLKQEGARLIEIASLSTSARNNIRSAAIYLEPHEMHLANLHPAMMFTTVLTLPNVDVRQVSNSMRTMITDANTQQMVPAGNSNSMVLLGIGQNLVSLVNALETIEAASALGSEKYVTQMELIRLENGVSTDMVSLLNAAYDVDPEKPSPRGLKFLPHARTNSILQTAPAGRIAGVMKLIAALDAK